MHVGCDAYACSLRSLTPRMRVCVAGASLFLLTGICRVQVADGCCSRCTQFSFCVRPSTTRGQNLRFIPPCSPVPAKAVPAGDDWLHEVKFDGYRVQATKWTRAGSST